MQQTIVKCVLPAASALYTDLLVYEEDTIEP